ncbi:golvesin C-terminal-like domain-containing protein [Salininema proteolyticum]|uniref:Polymorphic toxin-type HINT domain-containing protein n=1 Tax=Salininema proteolyticum TaxID=1607685 RepID=A0ABV8TSX4_9ACTN
MRLARISLAAVAAGAVALTLFGEPPRHDPPDAEGRATAFQSGEIPEPDCSPGEPPEYRALGQAPEFPALEGLDAPAWASSAAGTEEDFHDGERSLGHESWMHYTAMDTGAGSAITVNQATGNAVFSYAPFSNPGRGVPTFLRFTHNSFGRRDSPMGQGWSVSTSSVTSLGTTLEFLEGELRGRPVRVDLVDGDGTRHTWRLDRRDSTDPADWTYERPPGVALHLERDGEGWALVSPERVRHLFDEEGYQTAVEDNNGNRVSFAYEEVGRERLPVGLTDASGRRSLALDYYREGDEVRVWTGERWSVEPVEDLPEVEGRLKSATDASGRRIEVDYDRQGWAARLRDGAGTELEKDFTFRYEGVPSSRGALLAEVVDPLGNASSVGYDDERRASVLRDRRGSKATVSYGEDSAVYTDERGGAHRAVLDGSGRPVSLTDPLGNRTELEWSGDHKVVALTDARGNTTRREFDAVSGVLLSSTDAEGGTTRLGYEFSRGGHVADLASKSSPEGRTWSFAVDGNGNVVAASDPEGHATRYEYDEYGQITSATDAEGSATGYGDYDANGFPRRITDPFGCATFYLHDEKGNVTSRVDAAGNESTYTYDVFGRPKETVEPYDPATGREFRTPGAVYDANDQIVALTDADGAVTTTEYDAGGFRTAVTQPAYEGAERAQTTRYEYDESGNVVAETTPMGHTTRYEYDAAGRKVSMTDPLGQSELYEYDAVGNLTSSVDKAGNVHRTRYDRLGRLVEQVNPAGESLLLRYDADGWVTGESDEDGNWTLHTYDDRGLEVEKREPFEEEDGDVRYRTWEYEHDAVGNLVAERSPRGVASGDPEAFTTRHVYDKAHRPVETLHPYDPEDERLTEPDRTLQRYDALGNVVEVVEPSGEAGDKTHATRYEYFAGGQVKESVDPWGITTAYEYSPIGKQTRRTVWGEGLADGGDLVQRTQEWEFHPNGKLKRRRDSGVPVGFEAVVVDNSLSTATEAEGEWRTGPGPDQDEYEGPDFAVAESGDAEFAWRLDIPVDGEYEVGVRHPSGEVDDARFTVEHEGGTDRVAVDQTTRPGEWKSVGTFEFEADESYEVRLRGGAGVIADGLRAVRDNSGDEQDAEKEFTYRYDLDDNLVELSETSPKPYYERFETDHDPLGRAVEVREYRAGEDEPLSTEYEYDPLDNVTRWSQDEQEAEYSFDSLSRMVEVVNRGSAVDGPEKTTTFSYDSRSLLSEQVKPNGNTVSFEYRLDQTVRRQVEEKEDGTVVNEHRVEYTLNGHKSEDAMKVQNADDPGETEEFTYTYEYDPRDRVRRIEKSGDAEGSEAYVHDPNGNVVRETRTEDGEETVTEHVYDRNRLVRSETDGFESTHRYDPYGRLSRVDFDGEPLKRHTYDGFDRITETVSGSGGSEFTVAKRYDSFDRTRASEKSGAASEEREFFYLGASDLKLLERKDGDLHKSYQYAPGGELLSQYLLGEDADEDDRISYFSHSLTSDVESLTDEDGDNKSTYGYTAYGEDDPDRYGGEDEPVDPEEPDAEAEAYNEHRFNSAPVSAETGEYDMGFRDYDPGINSFLSLDVYNGALADLGLQTSPFTANRYTFAAGNPVTFIEFEGHFGWSDIGHAALDVAGLVPVVGEVADVANAAWYAAEGNYEDAALSLAGAVPFAGWGAAGVKAAKYGKKAWDAMPTGAAAKSSKKADPPNNGQRTPDQNTPPSSKKDGDGGGNGKTCPVNSFTGDTPVAMADGTFKPIALVREGDRVRATDDATGETKARTVTGTMVSYGVKTLVRITVDGGEGVTATDGHPFWTAADPGEGFRGGGWTEAGDLREGQWLRTSAGTWVQVSAVAVEERTATVHNLTVAGLHTFHVKAGDADLLTHNKGGDCVEGPDQGSGPVPDSQARDLAAEARDRLYDDMTGTMSKSQKGKYPMMVGATDKSTGNTVAAAKRAEPSKTKCAEDICYKALQDANPAMRPDDVVFSRPRFPNNGRPANYCETCVEKYGLEN